MAKCLTLLIVLLFARPVRAQIAVSANDTTDTLVDGVYVTNPNAPPDTVTLIDLSAHPPKIIGELNAPSSWSGPPQMIAVTPDESVALLSSSLKVNPADPTRTTQDNKISVIDLKSSPPAVVQTLDAGLFPNGIAINAAGTLALVTNRGDSTVSIYTISGTSVARAGHISLQDKNCAPSMPAFTPDGSTVYVTCTDTHKLAILSVNGTEVRDTGRSITANLRPVGIEITPKGDLSVVANIGNGPTGGVDTLTIVDIASPNPRVIDSVAVGIIPEGLALSPKGDYVAVSLINGTSFPKSNPFHHDQGILKILSFSGSHLTTVAETPVSAWCQGIAWSSDERTVVIQCMVERQIEVFEFDGKKLTRKPSIKMSGGPASIRTAWRPLKQQR
jgi:DNA-binding beta-propeller fold protein YncE